MDSGYTYLGPVAANRTCAESENWCSARGPCVPFSRAPRCRPLGMLSRAPGSLETQLRKKRISDSWGGLLEPLSGRGWVFFGGSRPAGASGMRAPRLEMLRFESVSIPSLRSTRVCHGSGKEGCAGKGGKADFLDSQARREPFRTPFALYRLASSLTHTRQSNYEHQVRILAVLRHASGGCNRVPFCQGCPNG